MQVNTRIGGRSQSIALPFKDTATKASVNGRPVLARRIMVIKS